MAKTPKKIQVRDLVFIARTEAEWNLLRSVQEQKQEEQQGRQRAATMALVADDYEPSPTVRAMLHALDLGRPDRLATAREKQLADALKRKETRPICGARTRAGGRCKMKCVPGRSRCRLHGGCSTGPTTAAGRAAISASNKRRAEARRESTAGSVAGELVKPEGTGRH